jgi:hypothetical protein
LRRRPAASAGLSRSRGDRSPSNRRVDLVWLTKRGNRVQDGFSTAREPLGTTRTDSRVRVVSEITIPDDLGGLHPVAATVDGDTVAVAAFSITPSIVEITPSSGPVGTPFEGHIKRVVWTEYNNTDALTDDNKFLGDACGFNSQGGTSRFRSRRPDSPATTLSTCIRPSTRVSTRARFPTSTTSLSSPTGTTTRGARCRGSTSRSR